MTTAVFEKFLETICTFENLASFSDADGFGGDELENFMKTNCLQTALIHNQKSKIREHIISLVNDEKKDISDNLIAIFRPLILMKKANMKQLHKYYCAQTETQKLDFVYKLILLQKEKRTHPRCPIITFLESLQVERTHQKDENHSEKIEKLTTQHKVYKIKCQELEKEVNELLGVSVVKGVRK